MLTYTVKGRTMEMACKTWSHKLQDDQDNGNKRDGLWITRNHRRKEDL